MAWHGREVLLGSCTPRGSTLKQLSFTIIIIFSKFRGRVSACAILNIGIREGVFVGTVHLDTLFCQLSCNSLKAYSME